MNYVMKFVDVFATAILLSTVPIGAGVVFHFSV